MESKPPAVVRRPVRRARSHQPGADGRRRTTLGRPSLLAIPLLVGCGVPGAPAAPVRLPVPPPGATAVPRSDMGAITPIKQETPIVPSSSSGARAPAAAAVGPPLAPSAPLHFPPADVPPPSAQSASAGDGRWTPFGDAARGERAAADPPLIVRTTLHPHPTSRFITVTLAAVDLSRVAVRLVPGTEDLAWAKRPAPAGAGLVPAASRDRLIAVTNGGFQPKHGRWGLVAGDVVIAPPREGGCTLTIDRSGAVTMGGWAPGAARVTPDLRQTPPCLLDRGAVHPALLAGKDRAWAGHAADVTTRRRSAAGLDESRSVLFYAIGEEAEPVRIAEMLRIAGASVAAELDINWYWTRFLLFGTTGASVGVTSTLVPGMEHPPGAYLEHASTRDFFFLERRE